MFACEIQLVILDKFQRAELIRWTDLPFVPQIGMRLNFDRDDELNYCEIQDVEYCVPEDVFWLSSTIDRRDGCSCQRGEGCCEFDASYWKGMGWKVRTVEDHEDEDEDEDEDEEAALAAGEA